MMELDPITKRSLSVKWRLFWLNRDIGQAIKERDAQIDYLIRLETHIDKLKERRRQLERQ